MCAHRKLRDPQSGMTPRRPSLQTQFRPAANPWQARSRPASNPNAANLKSPMKPPKSNPIASNPISLNPNQSKSISLLFPGHSHARKFLHSSFSLLHSPHRLPIAAKNRKHQNCASTREGRAGIRVDAVGAALLCCMAR